ASTNPPRRRAPAGAARGCRLGVRREHLHDEHHVVGRLGAAGPARRL
ncbi:MAG: hypothetical protein AVDCRST_MAG67-3319, partial [uncultured Solirubrobacteraceae bacterium]